MNDNHVPESVWRDIASGKTRRVEQSHNTHVRGCRHCRIQMKLAYMPLGPYSGGKLPGEPMSKKSLNDSSLPVHNADPYYAAGDQIIPLHIQKSLAASPSRWVERNTPTKPKK